METTEAPAADVKPMAIPTVRSKNVPTIRIRVAPPASMFPGMSQTLLQSLLGTEIHVESSEPEPPGATGEKKDSLFGTRGLAAHTVTIEGMKAALARSGKTGLLNWFTENATQHFPDGKLIFPDAICVYSYR